MARNDDCGTVRATKLDVAAPLAQLDQASLGECRDRLGTGDQRQRRGHADSSTEAMIGGSISSGTAVSSKNRSSASLRLFEGRSTSLVLIGVTAVALSIGASGAATASTETTDPAARANPHRARDARRRHRLLSMVRPSRRHLQPRRSAPPRSPSRRPSVARTRQRSDRRSRPPPRPRLNRSALAETVLAGGRRRAARVRRALRGADRLHEGELRLRRGQRRRLRVHLRGAPIRGPGRAAIFTLENAANRSTTSS